MIKKLILTFFLYFISLNTNLQQKNNPFELKVGDILFQDLDSSPLCEAIEQVTPGFKNVNLSHIGIITDIENSICANTNCCKDIYPKNHIRIIEALPGGVRTINLDSFLLRSSDNNGDPKVIVGRLKNKYQHTIPQAIEFAKNQIGTKYDELFLIDNDKYYCSELIYESFLQDSIFTLQPMTFLHPETHDTLQTWIDYYSKLNSKIPQNQSGINPGIISLSDKIEIVHFFGIPDGTTK